MISQTQLDAVIRQAENGPLNEALLARLRSEHPGIHFTCCMDDDVVVNAAGCRAAGVQRLSGQLQPALLGAEQRPGRRLGHRPGRSHRRLESAHAERR